MPAWVLSLKNGRYLENKALVAVLLGLFPLLYGWYVLTLGQDTNWDLQNYHIYNAYAFLNDRHTQDLMPAGLQSFFNPVLDILFWHTNAAFGPKGAAYLLAFLQGINISLILLLSMILFRKQRLPLGYVLPLACLALITPGFLSEAGTVLHDATVALFSTAALLVVVLALSTEEHGRRRPWLYVLAGFIVGLGCGLKPTLALNALALCLACLLCGRQVKHQFISAFIFGLGTLAGILVSGGFWLYEVWQLTGNPLFPQMNHIFGGELAMPISMRDSRFLPEGIMETVLYPVFFTADPLQIAEIPYKQLSWLLAFVLFWWGIAVVLYRLGNGLSGEVLTARPVRVLFIYLVLSYVLWLKMFGIYRYLVPLEILLPLACFLILAITVKKVPAFCWTVLLTATGLYNLQGVADWGHADWSEDLYSIDEPQDINDLSTVFLMGQPLAWLVPSFPSEVPFIQISPNFAVTDLYREQVRVRSDASGTMRLIYDPGSYDMEATARRAERLGFQVMEDSCEELSASLGQRVFTYQYCIIQSI